MGKSPHRQVERYRDKIVILGSGNVATHLAIAFDKVADVVQVWSRTGANAQILAKRLINAQATCNFSEIIPNADFYIIAVSDDAIIPVIRNIKDVHGIIAHTSGTFPLDEARKILKSENCGVLYPLQTFSKNSSVDVRDVPFLIEGANPITERKLISLALKISSNTECANSQTRAYIHLAAVFANNFANYSWIIADKILKENTNFNFSLFKPLLEESLRKALTLTPYRAQTGPAKRGDTSTIESQLNKLGAEYSSVYKLLTEKIIQEFNNDQPDK